MNRQIFIVKTTNGSEIVSERSLTKDINEKLSANPNPKVKQTDVISYAKSILHEYNGQSVDSEKYEELLKVAADVLIRYTTLTPYEFGSLLADRY